MKSIGLLLAAGKSQRFGSDKRLQRLPGGDTLLIHSAKILHKAVDDVLVVLDPEDEKLVEGLERIAVRHCFNSQADEGIGSSISYGVKTSLDADAWLVMPADLPLLRIDTIQRVLSALSPEGAVVPVCHGSRGHPVAFSRRFVAELTALTGSTGGRSILQRHNRDVTWLNVHDPGIYRDMDTLKDQQSLLRFINGDYIS
ncbi:MAG: nucleotidyltransferase family protein [Candidatus Thiodiazotropha sp. (ex Monitilora ramsayi)]|nr:nucleotidyltransferase family protein [Candidatus Thiodiazotropha sp. (ex Monitilora ramsayi)]